MCYDKNYCVIKEQLDNEMNYIKQQIKCLEGNAEKIVGGKNDQILEPLLRRLGGDYDEYCNRNKLSSI